MVNKGFLRGLRKTPTLDFRQRMIRKYGYRLSAEIMLSEEIERDDDSRRKSSGSSIMIRR
jgi:hypothetical protein